MEHHEIDPEHTSLAGRAAHALRAELPPEVARRHESLLYARASAGSNVRTLPRRRVRRRVAALAAAAMLILGGAGAGFAAEGTIPGDALYPVNRGMERIDLAFARSDGARAETHLAHAANRLDEIEGLVRADRHEHVPATADDAARSLERAFRAADEARGAGTEPLRQQVLDAITLYMHRLETVQARLEGTGVPAGEALDALEAARRTGSEIAAEATRRGFEQQPQSPVPGPPGEPAEPADPRGPAGDGGEQPEGPAGDGGEQPQRPDEGSGQQQGEPDEQPGQAGPPEDTQTEPGQSRRGDQSDAPDGDGSEAPSRAPSDGGPSSSSQEDRSQEDRSPDHTQDGEPDRGRDDDHDPGPRG